MVPREAPVGARGHNVEWFHVERPRENAMPLPAFHVETKGGASTPAAS
jgi:hypothetical protein